MVDLGILSRLGLGCGNSPGYPILLHRLFFFYSCLRIVKVKERLGGPLKILCHDLLIASDSWADLSCNPTVLRIFLLTSKSL